MSSDVRLLLVRQGSEVVQHMDSVFSEVTRSDAMAKGETRRLKREWFYRKLTNGEKVLRSWMAYSPSKASLFCICCRLFPHNGNDSKFSSADGLNSWWKLNPKVGNHESSVVHCQNFSQWKELELRIRKGLTIDKEAKEVVERETKRWRETLTRMADIIRFLAKQNLALRGHRKDDTSGSRGNFLELVHLLEKYDPVLREHLVSINMGQKISVTYMSSETQNEFIVILGDHVRQQIYRQIKKAKYYSIIFDSTPDISHRDQTSQVLRYVVIENQEVRVVESFIDFIETKSKTAGDIAEMILKKLNSDGLDIMDCRGQAYDNAAVMAGKHTGVQERIKDINLKAEFVPCSNHSLNLVCLHAASVEAKSVTFFGTLERCYAFFSMSTHRWEVLLAATGKSLKRIQDTRWSARGDAVIMMHKHYKEILTALEKLTAPEESSNTRADAGTLLVALESFSFLCFLGFWELVLLEINDAQNYLQTKGLNVQQCAQKISALQTLLVQKRNELVDGALIYSKGLCDELGLSMEPRRRRLKKQTFGDGSTDAGLTYENELRRTLFSSLDRVISEIRSRFQQLDNLAEKFSFLTPAKLLDVTGKKLM
ncbi:unnamed protein product [Chilo suppressalis]|uniref:DUF4371 domain-containing protein n=1 Tax=Chilo suppressalis TaxID=168631 RepID=A0ABN8AWL5_CHISP|nr:unnamed protein product [Chilo suppressalis]